MKGVAKLLAIGGVLFAISCGGETPNEQMSSVVVYASVNETNVNVDTAKWQDTNGDNICDSYSIEDTNIQVSFNVTPIPNLPEGISPSPVVIERVEIVYTPERNNYPQLNTRNLTLGVTVEPETTAEVPITIFTVSQKIEMIDRYFMLRINPELPVYSYYVTLRFKVREIYSNDTETIERQTYIQVSDFGPEANCQ